MSPRSGSSPLASLVPPSALEEPASFCGPVADPPSSREQPFRGLDARDEAARQRDELAAENAALRARLELMSTLTRAAWWDWDTGAERVVAHGDVVELVQLELPADLGASGLGRWLQLLHPDDARRARAAFSRCVSAPGEIAACSLRVRARAGGYRTVLFALTSCEAALGSLRVLGAARDVHADRRADDVARRNAQVLATVPAAIVCVDMEGVIDYVNDAATRLLGDCVGRSFIELFPTADRGALADLLRDASDGGAPGLRLEGTGGKPDLWLELSTYDDTAGKPAGLVCVIGDCSERLGAGAPS
jgi:PAS domain S-box-containing protein